jgi:predicted amidohydrolase
MTFRLALVQMRVDGGDPDANLARAAERVETAARLGAQVVLLPECMDLGWTHPSAQSLAGPIPGGRTFESLCASAVRNGIYLCAGIVERDGERTYNSAVLIGPEGDLLLKHRKLNELDIGHPFYAQGDRLGVCETPYGTFGLMICADAFAKDGVIARSLGYMGADVILSPSAWAVSPDHDNQATPYGSSWDGHYAPVCREFALWIAGVSNVGPIVAGPWQEWNCIGCSRVVVPDGTVAATLPYGIDADTVEIVEIDPVPRPARGCAWNAYWRK